MTITNASFETPGVEPGQAENWSEDYSYGVSDIGDFQNSDGYSRPYDDFEDSWYDNQDALESLGLTDKVAALFINLSVQFESFETSWWEPHTVTTDPHNGAAYLYYYSGNFLHAAFDSEDMEDFEEYWGTSPYNQASIYTHATGSFTTATFDSGVSEAKEDFEEEWKSNENAATQILSIAVAAFDPGAPEGVEDFEDDWAETLP